MNEHDFTALVVHNREEVPVGHPPADLLRVARAARRQRRLKVLGATFATVLAAGLVVVGVRAVGDLGSSSGASTTTPSPSRFPSTFPSTGTKVAGSAVPDSARATRQVGIDGWVITVPDRWGTDQVRCDKTTAARPTVVFDHHSRATPGCPRLAVLPRMPSVLISGDPVPATRWRTISGVAVRRHVPRSGCHTCATITVPSTGATFDIRARSTRQLSTIEHSLRPLTARNTTVPVWQVPQHGRAAPDQMTQIALASGLWPHTVERPSTAPPGQFLESNPPIGTPVDLGRAITIVYSAGDLASYATTHSLHRHGWDLMAAGDFSPPVDRDRARAIAARRGVRPGTDVFLRTLTITHSVPAGRQIRTVLAWLVVSGTEQRGGRTSSTLTAVDAVSGRILETRAGFVGRR